MDRPFKILDWLPSYSVRDLRNDLPAGLTVGVMLIPQSMAYAILLGVPPVYGLYASLVPLVLYPVFGTSRHLAVGIIAIDMLVAGAGLSLIAEPGSDRFIALAILLTCMVGFLQILMGLLRMGFIVNLLSRPVIAGFTSAAALIISFSQLGNLLGIDLPHTLYVAVVLWHAAGQIEDVHAISALIGVSGIFVLIALRRWRPLIPGPLVVVVLATAIVWLFALDARGVAVVGGIPTGLPAPEVPVLDARSLRALLPTALTLALVQFMTVISLGKVFGARHRYRVEPNSELLAIGVNNFAGSFFKSIPVSASFSRTVVNDLAGGRTPLSNVVAALVVGTTLLFVTPLFEYLPIPILAAIIVFAAIILVDVEEIRLLIHMKRVDGAIALFAFASTLIAGVLEGILLGIAASIVAVIYRISRPYVAVLGRLPGTESYGDLRRHAEAVPTRGMLILRVEASLSFTNAEFLRDLIMQRTQVENGALRVILLDASGINDVDTTAVELLIALADTLRERGIELVFGGVKGAVWDTLTRSGLVDRLGRDRFFTSTHDAVVQIQAGWDAEYEKTRSEEAS